RLLPNDFGTLMYPIGARNVHRPSSSAAFMPALVRSDLTSLSNCANDASTPSINFHGAAKYQAGTPDVAGPVGLAAAIDFFERAGQDALRKHDLTLVRHGLARLRAVRNLRLIGSTSDEQRVPVFTFTLAGASATSVAAKLDEQGIAVRAG